jgi:2-dehydro-3-deoxygluconokinase
MSTTVATFGEIMLRLKAPAFERLLQSPMLEATFGGGEANVAVSLASYGLDARFVTVVPANPIGDACLAELRRRNVDTRCIRRNGDRLGVYFLEAGANQRPSKVVYDRTGSAISQAQTGDIDWDDAFDGAGWFHVSGITPALSQGAAELSIEAVKTAKQRGLTVSCDLNYRKKLWNYGKGPAEVMTQIIPYVDVAIGNEEDYQKSLGVELEADVEGGSLDRDRYADMAERVLEDTPSLTRVAVTLRESHSASHNGWSAMLAGREGVRFSKTYEITHIVDRVGAGDSFAAGLIYGLTSLETDEDALEFATAASCLKHSVPGDFALLSVAEVAALAGGEASGRVQR